MATQVNSNYVVGASAVEPRRLLMNVAGGRTLIHSSATTSIPMAVSRNAAATTDPSASLEYDLLEIGKVYELNAHAAVSSGARVGPQAAGRAATQAGAGVAYFIALDADGSAQGKTFSAVYTGPVYHAS